MKYKDRASGNAAGFTVPDGAAERRQAADIRLEDGSLLSAETVPGPVKTLPFAGPAFAVTCSKEPGEELAVQGQLWAAELGAAFVPRYGKGSLQDMVRDLGIEALLIATREGPRVYTEAGTYFYHPGLGTVRWQRVVLRQENDNFLTALDAKPGQRILDCTLGLAADALLASHAVGAGGQVTGLEASTLLWFLTRQGVRAYRGKFPELTEDLQRIRVLHREAASFLAEQEPDSFDAVYFDPMFRMPIRRSSSMAPLRPLAYGEPLDPAAVELALRVAPRVVIKERSEEILREYGCTKFTGTRYSAVRFGIRERD